jgi:DNA helicase-2/ATP-dependent DNA helicase PcrA
MLFSSTRNTKFRKPYQTKSFHSSNKQESLQYGVGDTISHVKFGKGTVTEIVSGGRDYEVTVDFEKCGTKKMFASFAKLKKVE